MTDLYYCPTSNGMRAVIALLEAGIAFTPHRLDMAAGETRTPEYLKINPAGTAPILVGTGPTPVKVVQSGAIALYAAEVSGRMLPTDVAGRALAIQWLMFACSDCAGASSGISMMAKVADTAPADMYKKRLVDLMRVANQRLAESHWLAGDTMTVADVALFPVLEYRRAVLADSAGDMPHLARWSDEMVARPAVRDGVRLIAGI